MKQLKKPTIWIPAIALLVYAVTLFLFPIFVRDNGENFRFLTANHMYRSGDLWYGFDVDFAALKEMPFSVLKLLYQAVIAIWHGLFGLEVIDIRLLSVVYVALTVFALWVIARNLNLRTPLTNLITGVLVLVIAIGGGMFSYFNTFYREGAVLPFLLLAIAGILEFSRSKTLWSALLFFVGACGMVTISPVCALLVFFFFFAGIRLACLPMRWWKRVALLLLTAMLLPFSWFGLSSQTEEEYQENLYNAVFYGALSDCDDGEVALQEIGLDDALSAYINKPYFEVTDKEPLNDLFYPNFDYSRLAQYYFKNPSSFLSVVKQAGNNVYETSISYLRSDDDGQLSLQRLFSAPTRWFETLQLRFLPRGVVSWLVYLILFVILACVRRKTLEDDGEKAQTDCGIIFASMPLVLLAAAPFVSGLTEISKRLFYTNAVFEIFLVLLLAYAIELILLRRNRLREQYGVNQ